MRARIVARGAPTRAESWRRAVKDAGIGVFWIAVGIYWCCFGVALEFVWLGRPSDFSVYYAAAEALRYSNQAPIYEWHTLAQTVAVHGGCPLLSHITYVYPPLFAILLSPLTQAPCGALLPAWHVFNLALLGGTVLLLTRLLHAWWPGRPRRHLTAIVLLTTAFWLPIFWALWLGQVAVLVLAGLVLALWLQEHDHPILSGAVLGFITLIQLFPAIMIVMYVLRGQWRVIVGVVLSAALALALMLAAVGLRGVLSMTSLFHNGQPMMLVSANIGLLGVPIVGPALLSATALCFVIVVYRLPKADGPLIYGWAICTMLLVAPVTWPFFLTWLLPVFIICLGSMPASMPPRRVYAALLVIYVLSDLATTIPHVATVGMVALWALCGWLVVQSAQGVTERRVATPT